MAAPVLFTHPASLEHDTGGGHPERADRIRAIDRELEARGGLGWERRTSPAASRETLLAVHPADHLDRIEAFARSGGGHLDADTVVSPGSWVAALHAAGGAIAAVDALLGEGDRPRAAAAAHRPPGHHCETDRAMGFCLLSTAAIAARHAVVAHGLERVMLIDWDVHHGNGTQQVLEADPTVLFASIHGSPLYPGTGSADEVGVGAGEGFTVNVPVPAGSGDRVFGSAVEHVFVPIARAWRPELILVSAGYDAHEDDPLASCTVTDAGFAGMARSAASIAREVGAPVALTLEGGYDVDALGRSFAETLAVLGATESPAPWAGEKHPLADRAWARVADSSPVVG